MGSGVVLHRKKSNVNSEIMYLDCISGIQLLKAEVATSSTLPLGPPLAVSL